MSNIFISHSSKDNDFAKKITAHLNSIGHKSIFLDFDPNNGIPAGRNWEKELYANLRKCKLVIVLVSESFVSSRWCFAEITQARALGKYIIPLKISNCTVDAVLSDVQAIDATIDLSEAFKRLENGLVKAGVEKEVWDHTRPPYPGLLAFEEEDEPVFFGRENETDHLLQSLRIYQRLGGQKLLVILGASGSGKSSLLRAGLIPRLRKEKRSWLIIGPFRPLKPFEELSKCLAKSFIGFKANKNWKELYHLLSSDAKNTDSKHTQLSEVLSELIELSEEQNITVLLFIDQFEELLADADKGSLEENIPGLFLSYLRRFLNTATNKVLVVATLRSDFLKNFQENENVKELSFTDYIVQFISPEGLKASVVEPAKIAGIELEEGLADIMMKDTGTSDALPLLAFALRELWEQYGKDGLLEIDEYKNKLGGLEGSVARVAEAVLAAHIAETGRGKMVKTESNEKKAKLHPDDENNLKAAFMTLVRIDEEGRYTKRFANGKGLPPSISGLLQRFVAARLLTTSGDEKDSKIEVAHEALFRTWARLANWLEEDKSFLIWRKRLNISLEEWKRTSKDDSELLRGPALVEASEWLQANKEGKYVLAHEEIDFIKAAETKYEEEKTKEEQRRQELEEKNKQLELALIEAKEQTLQARAKALAATARQLLQTDPTMGLRLAEAACKITPLATKEAQAAVVDILRQKRGFYKNIFEQLPVWVVSVAISPDGNYILTGGSNETARLWHVDGTLKQIFKRHLDFVSAVAFSPDGNHVLTGGSDKTAVLWDIDGTQKQSFETKRIYNRNGTLKFSAEGHKEGISSVAFSPDGQYILTGSGDKTAKLWSIDGTLKFTFEGHTERISSIAFSPKGEYVLTGSGDNTAKLWNLDGTLKQSFEGHSNYVSSVAFSPDGNHVLTGSADKTAKLWNIYGTLRKTFDRHADIVYSVAYSPDGKYVLTGCADKTARLWKLDGTLKHSFEAHTHAVISVAFSSDGKYLVTASYGGATLLWNIDKILTKSFEGQMDMISTTIFSPNGKYALVGDYYATAKLWNVDGTLNQSFEKQIINDSSIAFSPDSKYVLIGKDNLAKLWNLDGTMKQSFEGHAGNVTSVAFSANGKYILTTSFDKTVKIWNLNGKLKQSFREFQNEDPPPEFQVEFKTPMAAFSPDSKTILVGDWGPTVKLYSLDGKLLHTFNTDLYTISSIAFSPNGNDVLTGGRHGTILWDVGGTRKQTFNDYSEYAPRVTFTPNGKYILITSSDKYPKLWNLDGTLKHSFEEHPKSICAFSPDGKYILIASGNKAQLFDFDGTLMQSFEDHSMEVLSVAFSPDGNFILTGSHDRSAKIWCTFWHLLNSEAVYVPTAEQMKEYDIPEDMEWGKIW